MMMYRKIISLLIAAVLILALPCAVAEDGVTDIYGEGHVLLGSMSASEGMLAFTLSQSADNGWEWRIPRENGCLTAVMDQFMAPGENEALLGIPGQHRIVCVPSAPGNGIFTIWFSKMWIHGYPAQYTISVPYVVDGSMHLTAGVPEVTTGTPIADSVEEQMSSDPQFGSITFKNDAVELYTGKTLTLSPKASEYNISKKGYTFTSNDESVATVNSEGRIKGVSQGTCIVQVTSKSDERVWARVTVKVLQQVTKVTVTAPADNLGAGSTLQLTAAVEPDNADNKAVTWSSSDKTIATVDENGLVTGVKKGSVTITAKSADNKEITGRIKLNVTQGVTGVTLENEYLRVGVGYYNTVTAKVLPTNASNKNMTWYSTNDYIATVKGSKNEVRVTGKNWGECDVVGITEEGGYTVTLHVLVGSMGKAVRITGTGRTVYGGPQFTLQNDSNLTMSKVHIAVKAFDYYGQPVVISTYGDGYILNGDYNYYIDPASGGSSEYIQYIGKLNYGWDGIAYLQVAVTGWESADQYTTTKGGVSNKYTLGESSYIWENCGTPVVYAE